MGSCTATRVKKYSAGSTHVALTNVTLSASYATGGDALTKAQIGVPSVCTFVSVERGAAGEQYAYDRTNSKILSYNAAGTQTSNATDLSAVTVKVRAEGY